MCQGVVFFAGSESQAFFTVSRILSRHYHSHLNHVDRVGGLENHGKRFDRNPNQEA